MDFGRKREIAQLRRQLESVAEQPHLQLAQEIDANVRAEVENGDMPLDIIMERAVAKAETSVYLAILSERLHSLSTLELLQTFDRHIGSEEVSGLLRRLTNIEVQKLKRQELIDELKREGELTRMVNLARIPVGSTIKVGFFDPEDDNDEKCFDYEEDSVRDITFRVDTPGKPGLLTVIKDINDDWNYEKVKGVPNRFDDHQLVRLGSLKWSGSTSTFEPTLTHGTYAAFVFNDKGPKVFSYDVGYVLVNDQLVLDSNG